MSNYETWRISFQSSEQAARAAFEECAEQSARIETRDKLIQQLHSDVADLRAQLAAANKRLEEAEKQEPVGEVQAIDEYNDSWLFRLDVGTKLYTLPIPPADVAELQRQLAFWKNSSEEWGAGYRRQERRIAELERRLAEQQAINVRLQAMTGSIVNPHEELNKLLSEAREEGRKEAVPDGLLEKLTRYVVVNEIDGRKWVELCDIESALAATPSPAS